MPAPCGKTIRPKNNSMKKFFLPVLGIIFFTFIFALKPGYGQEPRKLKVFYSLTCDRCAEIKNTVMPEVEKKFKGRITIEYLEISDVENYKQLLALEEKHGAKIKNTLPVFYCEGYFLNGTGNVKSALLWVITQALQNPAMEGNSGELPAVDLIARFKAFEPLAITSAGLIDGINPCAFTVIVFFISFLALQGYKRRDLAIIGLAFILAVFLTYLLIGVGVFTFLYRLKGFWVFTKVFNFLIGSFSIVLGFFALYDLIKFMKTGQADELALQLPQAVKNRIHSVIGLYYRQPKTGLNTEVVRRASVLRLTSSALITGFLVALLELICTGQVYLPTITFVLKAAPLKIQALGFLLLYNLMFILPLFVIFLFALLGVTSGQFAAFLKKHLLTVKLLMAVLFFGLGVFLLTGRG